LNYANGEKYGELLEVAGSVWENRGIDLNMGNVNVIWQEEADEVGERK